MIAFVPFPPPPPPPVPVVNVPKGSPPSGSPAALSPSTIQEMFVFAGNDGSGVQVSTVSPALHDGVVVMKLKLGSKKVADVILVFIAALKVKTTVVVDETPVAPFAGTVEVMIGWA